MHRYSKLLLASLATTALLAVAVSSASANRLSVSNRNIRAVWSSLELTNTVNTNTVRCPVTLEGSFHSSTISKVVGALIGYVTRAEVNTAACSGGRATIQRETLPWHIRYRSFTGTLPRISGITIGLIGATFEIETAGNTCRARTTAESPAVGIVNTNTTTGVAESLTADSAFGIPLVNGAGGIFCGLASGRFGGTTTSLTLLGSNTTKIVVRLI